MSLVTLCPLSELIKKRTKFAIWVFGRALLLFHGPTRITSTRTAITRDIFLTVFGGNFAGIYTDHMWQFTQNQLVTVSFRTIKRSASEREDKQFKTDTFNG